MTTDEKRVSSWGRYDFHELHASQKGALVKGLKIIFVNPTHISQTNKNKNKKTTQGGGRGSFESTRSQEIQGGFGHVPSAF